MKNHEKTDKEIRRTIHNFGGIGCPCCNYWRLSPRKTKPLERRYIRRKMKQVLRNEERDDAA